MWVSAEEFHETFRNSKISSLSPFPSVIAVHMHFGHPCHSVVYPCHHAHAAHPLPRYSYGVDDGGDTGHLVSQYRRQSRTRTPMIPTMMIRRIVLAYGRYNKFSTSFCRGPHCPRHPRPMPHAGGRADHHEDVEFPQELVPG